MLLFQLFNSHWLPSISCTTTPPSPSQKSSVTFWSEERPHKHISSRHRKGEQRQLLLISFFFVYLHSSIIAAGLLWRRGGRRRKKRLLFGLVGCFTPLQDVSILYEVVKKQVQSWALSSRKHLNGLSIHLRDGPSFFIPPWQHVS
jgi:hypothetical protein